ncbi:hypothetical protein EVAR_71212_1 [Eumeta japonica]|uniref:Uncharacterized protein n=1 Tax=Eumeta variegata TaxID=151549 RepID=A0A4C1SHS9_EUMVA|nr:hypothetical protein EVAR_71212_1 [Eumeta japonica]
MRSLANSGVTEDFLRSMWLQCLPQQTQAILATSAESLDNLAIMADKIGEISNSNLNNIAGIQTTNELSELKQQIFVLTEAVKNLQMSRGQHSSRSVSRNRSRRRYNNNKQVCYYHRKFGNNAHSCRKPCSFAALASENSQGGH